MRIPAGACGESGEAVDDGEGGEHKGEDHYFYKLTEF